MMFSPKLVWDSFSRVISQAPLVGGLEISPEALRYVLIKGQEIRTASLRLPPGLIGKQGVKDQTQFKQALLVLVKQIRAVTGITKKLHVVVSLPFSNTYLQVFKLPPVAEKDLENAADLNMQMIAPIPVESSYYDFEQIGEADSDTQGQMEFLGAFAPAAEVESFVKPIIESGFSVVAVEFASLALTRLANDLMAENKTGVTGSGRRDFLLTAVGSRGVDFMVIRKGWLYFDYFVSWEAMGIFGSNWSPAALAAGLTRSLQQVFNFYSGRWGGSLKEVIILAPGGYEMVAGAIKQSFANLTVAPLLSRQWPQLDQRWLVAVGLAQRGLISRSRDKMISLARIGTEDLYRNEQVIAFIKFWRNIAMVSMGFLIFVFGISNLFLSQVVVRVKGNSDAGIAGQFQNIQEQVEGLEAAAADFNQLTESISLSAKEKYSWEPFFRKIRELAGDKIKLNRVFYQSPKVPVVISGVAMEEKAVIDFKDRLLEEPGFTSVNLPLSNISYVSGRVSFNLSFLIKELATK